MDVKIEFERNRLLMIVNGSSIKALRRIGAYVRATARNAVFQSNESSLPGTPPNTRRGLLRNSLLFGVENQQKIVVIGPAVSFIGLAMTAHEYGGLYRGRKYPKRALMAPTLKKALPKLPKLFENTVK